MAQVVALVDEEVLILRAQRGDRSAFADLVEHYWDRLYRWLHHLTHDRHAAEDVAQEAFLKAFTALPSFQAGTRFQAWIFRIAHNVLINQQRPRGKVRQAFPDELVSPELGPEELALGKEAMQQLARAVGRLPSDFRAAFLLRAEQDLSFAEIAQALDTTEATARWRVCKARQKLMEVMQPFLSVE